MKQSPSSETDRPIPRKELKMWSAILEKLRSDLGEARNNETLRHEAILNAQFMADFLRDKIEPYIDETISFQRLKEAAGILAEQEELMHAHRPDWEKRQFQAYLNPPRKDQPMKPKRSDAPSKKGKNEKPRTK
jgi:hypothetical protein